MFREKTLFIIGAGASAELDLPLGVELIKSIRDDPKFGQLSMGDKEFHRLIRRVCGDQADQNSL